MSNSKEDRFSGGTMLESSLPASLLFKAPFVSLFRDLRHFLWVGLAAGGGVRKMLVKDKCVSFD